MDIKSLTAPCGIDCFNCQVYEKNISEQMKTYLAAALKKSKDEVACKGCREQKGCVMYPLPCATLECVKNKGFEFCYECSDFPCDKFIPSVDQAEKYPHNLKVFNLCKIKNCGLEKWAEETPNIREKYFKGKFIVGQGPTV